MPETTFSGPGLTTSLELDALGAVVGQTLMLGRAVI